MKHPERRRRKVEWNYSPECGEKRIGTERTYISTPGTQSGRDRTICFTRKRELPRAECGGELKGLQPELFPRTIRNEKEGADHLRKAKKEKRGKGRSFSIRSSGTEEYLKTFRTSFEKGGEGEKREVRASQGAEKGGVDVLRILTVRWQEKRRELGFFD